MATVSSEVLRAGRALLELSQSEMAEAAGISIPTLRRIETTQKGVSVDAVKKVQDVLESKGVEFLPATTEAHEGVRRRKKDFRFD